MRIAYAAQDRSIRVHDANAGGEDRVVSVPGLRCEWPLWSPDGSLIAFSARVAGSDRLGVYAAGVDEAGSRPAVRQRTRRRRHSARRVALLRLVARRIAARHRGEHAGRARAVRARGGFAASASPRAGGRTHVFLMVARWRRDVRPLVYRAFHRIGAPRRRRRAATLPRRQHALHGAPRGAKIRGG